MPAKTAQVDWNLKIMIIAIYLSGHFLFHFYSCRKVVLGPMDPTG